MLAAARAGDRRASRWAPRRCCPCCAARSRPRRRSPRIDLLSGGRLVVAVGAAFPGRFGRPVHALSEVPWEARFGRLDETVALWRRLWSADGPSDFHGEVLNFDDIPAATPAYRKGGPPIWYGGASGAALERTGRLYDGWLPYPPDPEDYRTGLAEVRRAAARPYGRHAGALRVRAGRRDRGDRTPRTPGVQQEQLRDAAGGAGDRSRPWSPAHRSTWSDAWAPTSRRARGTWSAGSARSTWRHSASSSDVSPRSSR